MKENVLFCPACGTPSIEASSLAGGEAACQACSWAGKNEELVAVPIQHDFASREDMLLNFIKQLASTLAKSSAVEVGGVLLKWGFLDQNNMQAELQAYIKGMALAAGKSILETRQHLERSRANRAAKDRQKYGN